MKNFITLILACLSIFSCSKNEPETTPTKEASDIVLETSLNYKMYEDFSIDARLVGAANTPLTGQSLKASIKSGDAVLSTTDLTTDSDGRFTLVGKLEKALNSEINIEYNGDEQHFGLLKAITLVATYGYRPPKEGDGLTIGNLAETGINLRMIGDFVDLIRNNGPKYININSFLIQHKGELVLEEYFPFEENQFSGSRRQEGNHLVASVSKSVTSACIGIAIDKGMIESAEVLMVDHINGRTVPSAFPKNTITLQNILNMRTGIDCNDRGDWVGVTGDYIQYQLDLPLANSPGSNFRYCTGNTMILGEMIRSASGLDAQQFAQKYLFDPMGIDLSRTEWTKDPNGNVMCGYGLWMHARDMIKFGQLYLDKGVYKGKRILSEDWVKASVENGPSTTITFANRVNYGNQWWIGDHKVNNQHISAYYAIGNGGNYIINIPDLETVVVFHAAFWNDNSIHTTLEVEAMDKYLLPAILEAFQ